MSKVIDTLIPPCPPYREIKSTKKNKRTTRVKAIDFDNDEDSLTQSQQNTKYPQSKRIPKVENFDEENQEKPTQKLKKEKSKKKLTSQKKKFSPPTNKEQNKGSEEYYYKSSKPISKKMMNTRQRPKTFNSKKTPSFYENNDEKEKSTENYKFNEISIDDYENPDVDDYEEQLISNHTKINEVIPLQQQKKINSNQKRTKIQCKMVSSSNNKKAVSVPKTYEYGSLGKSTLMNFNSNVFDRGSVSKKKDIQIQRKQKLEK